MNHYYIAIENKQKKINSRTWTISKERFRILRGKTPRECIANFLEWCCRQEHIFGDEFEFNLLIVISRYLNLGDFDHFEKEIAKEIKKQFENASEDTFEKWNSSRKKFKNCFYNLYPFEAFLLD